MSSRIFDYCPYSETIKKLENDSSFVYYETQLVQTLSYLETRYTVRFHFDRFTNPTRYQDDMLFKIYSDKQMIMWVYFIFHNNTHYISLECEPQHIKSVRAGLNGFTKIKDRSSHPQLKLYFEDFEEIRDSLKAICDVIDSHFGIRAPMDINTAVPPLKILDNSSGRRFVCPNCKYEFKENSRCPECGQLIAISDITDSNERTIRIGDDVSGLKIFEIINKCFGKNYKAWMKGGYDINDEYWAWFPTVYTENVRPGGGYGGKEMWSNTVSPDRKTVISVNHDVSIDESTVEERNAQNPKKKVLIFARIKGSFEFLGVFNEKIVIEDHLLACRHDRIAEGINLSTFELINETKR